MVFYTDPEHTSEYVFDTESWFRNADGSFSHYTGYHCISAGTSVNRPAVNGQLKPEMNGYFMGGTDGLASEVINCSNYSKAQAMASRPIREGIGMDPNLLPPFGHTMINVCDWIDLANGVTTPTSTNTEPFTLHYENPGLH